MSVSFGLAKKIIEHPSYNLGLALPFVAAFYLLNDTDPIALPLLGVTLGEQLSAAIKILGVSFYYAVFLFFVVLAAGLSRLTSESKLYLAYPIFTGIVGVLALLVQNGAPKIGAIFGMLSLAFLLLQKYDDGQLSVLLVTGTMTILSLFSFVAGVLWFEGHLIFAPAIAALFGFQTLAPDSLKLGWAMLVTLGYVQFYAVFQTSELWAEAH